MSSLSSSASTQPLSSSSTPPSSSQSSSSSQQMEEKGDEAIMKVPHEFMEFPLGFVLDAGGSVTKLLYRSLKDYKNGKLLKPSDHGLLRLKYFNMNEIDHISTFLKNNCDIMDAKETFDVTWFLTGVTTQHFKTKFQEDLGGIKTKLYSEMLGIQGALKATKFINIGHYELNHEVLVDIAKNIKILFAAIKRHSKVSDDSMEKYITEAEDNNETKKELAEVMSKLDDTDISEVRIQNKVPEGPKSYVQLIFEPNVDWKDWSEKNLESDQGQLVTPSLFALFGSACMVFTMDEQMNLKPVDFLGPAGKAFCGILDEMTGINDFDTLMKMAERGNLDEVNVQYSDLRNQDHQEDDMYTGFPEDFVIFDLGKLTPSYATKKGNYTKDDIAAGMLSYQCLILSKMLIMNCRVHKVNTVYMCGSLVKYNIARKFIEKHFLGESLKYSLEGNPFIKIHFLHNPGFLVGLGTWSANVEIAKELKESKESKV